MDPLKQYSQCPSSMSLLWDSVTTGTRLKLSYTIQWLFNTFYVARKVTCCAPGGTYIAFNVCIPSKETQLQSAQLGSGVRDPHFKAIPIPRSKPGRVPNVSNTSSRIHNIKEPWGS